MASVSAARDQAIQEQRRSLQADTCCICCDDEQGSPNIATLCCGLPVHLNCMSRWLATAEQRGAAPSCPSCRAAMPAAELAERLRSDSTDTSVDTTDDTTTDDTAAGYVSTTEGDTTLEEQINAGLYQRIDAFVQSRA